MKFGLNLFQLDEKKKIKDNFLLLCLFFRHLDTGRGYLMRLILNSSYFSHNIGPFFTFDFVIVVCFFLGELILWLELYI